MSTAPPALERGRYAIFETPDGGWAISRAVDTCETCRTCGCGEQQDLITVPAMAIALGKQMATQPAGMGRLMGMLKAATGRG